MSKIREAYYKGNEGGPAPERRFGLQRLAHRLGQSGLGEAEKQDRELERSKQAQFDEALANAKGPNKQALQVIQEAAMIPREMSSRPGWGQEFRHQDGTRTMQWHARLSAGKHQDPSRPHNTPLTDSLGALYIDSPDWTHDALNVPVDNVTIVSTAPMDAEDHIGAATSVIYFNTRPYDPDTMELKHSNDFTGGMKVSVGPAGEIVSFDMTRENRSGYTPEDPARIQVDLAKFLDTAHLASYQTVESYQNITGDPDRA